MKVWIIIIIIITILIFLALIIGITIYFVIENKQKHSTVSSINSPSSAGVTITPTGPGSKTININPTKHIGSLTFT